MEVLFTIQNYYENGVRKGYSITTKNKDFEKYNFEQVLNVEVVSLMKEITTRLNEKNVSVVFDIEGW